MKQYSNCDPQVNNFKDPMFRAIFKYKDQPSVLAIENKCKNNNSFTFSEVSIKEIVKAIRSFKTNKIS